jgi:hypothetical protein
MVGIRDLLLVGALAVSSVSAGCALPLRVSQYDYGKPDMHELHELVRAYESAKQDEVGIQTRFDSQHYEISFTQIDGGVDFDLGVRTGEHWTRFYGTLEEGVAHGFTALSRGHGQFRRTPFTAGDVEEDQNLRMTYTLAMALLRRTARTGQAEPLYPRQGIRFSVLGNRLW